MGHCEVDFTDASDDADPCEFVNTRFVVARKEHTCSSCRGPIAKGEKHKVSAYRFEGEFGSERMCGPCYEAAGEFGYHLLGGDLWGMFAEEWDNGAHLQSCLNRLTTARAKEHMRQQWLKWEEERAAFRRRMLERRKAHAAVDPQAGSSSE